MGVMWSAGSSPNCSKACWQQEGPGISLTLVLCPLCVSAGRASLHGKASLQIDPVRSEDQGWYECRVLMLEQQYDTFHNGSWVHLTVNGESPAPPTATHICVSAWELTKNTQKKERKKTCVRHLDSNDILDVMR